MNDYLWNKKGSDPDIKELENTLQHFRASKYSAVRPRPEINGSQRPFLDWLKLAFAVPALAALVLSALFYFNAEQEIQPVAVAADFAAPMVADIGAVTEEVPAAKPPERVTKVPTLVRNRRIKRFPVQIRTRNQNPLAPRRISASTITATSKPEFTVEEQEAYTELMRALTITSAKLRLIKDKVEGPANAHGTK